MNYFEIRNLLNQQPFEPLAFTFADGTVEIVRHPEMALPGASSVVIARFEKGEEAPWLASYSLAQLVSIKPASRLATN